MPTPPSSSPDTSLPANPQDLSLPERVRKVGQALEQDQPALAWKLAAPLVSGNAAVAAETLPDEALRPLASAALAAGEAVAALPLLIRLKDIQPQDGWNWHLLAIALRDLGQLTAAVSSWKMALTYSPGQPACLLALAGALSRDRQYAEADRLLALCCRQQPGQASLVLSRSRNLLAWGKLEDAAALLLPLTGPPAPSLPDKSIQVQALVSLGWLHRRQGQLPAAIDFYRRALALDPDNVDAHWNLASALLLSGDLKAGFREFEWRFRRGRTLAVQRPLPLWEGQPLAGRRLLVTQEQGLGDTIQMLRLAAPLAAAGATVLWETRPTLFGLAATAAGVAEIVPPGVTPDGIDWQIPALSLPHRLGLTLETLPAPCSYLSPPLGAPVPWGKSRRHRRVALVWRGNPGHEDDAARSVPLALLAPLAGLAQELDLDLICCQPPDNRPDMDSSLFCEDAGPWLDDFSATARLLAGVELVIAVDTACLHLAGALGRPAIGLLPFAPDWRWMLERSDSPWYPSLHLLRQPCPGGWDEVVSQLLPLVRHRFS